MSVDPAPKDTNTAVRPFHVAIGEEDIADLQRRIAAWRPPEREPVDDQSQGVQLATIRDLADYWSTGVQLAEMRGEAEHARNTSSPISMALTSISFTPARLTKTRCL